MKNYVGIDLGTTNSAIASFDGENLRLYKSPDQTDVTPSAIFIDRRGKKYIGKDAYNAAARQPGNAATKFKKMMGTSTPMKLPAVNLIMSPEECSAEILKVCFGYLPEEIRNDPETGTVITVPAAFNQMQKNATMAAAEMAGLGKIALMQEPVAAVMSVMRKRKGDGIFLVYDLGGGTLDIAIADCQSGRVNLLAHGGIQMCGGTDFDREILDNVVKPWLFDKFDLPDDMAGNPKYKTLLHLSLHASEKAKIELSTKEETVIASLDLNILDESGAEIYLDIPFARARLDQLIAEKIADSIQAARDTIEEAGLSHGDIGRIVFVGGPTHYPSIRDRVCFELGIPAGKNSDGTPEVNPMTAVAEGAAVYAESIDWSSQSRGRKNSRGTVSAGGNLDLSFVYTARTPKTTAKIMVKLSGIAIAGAEFQINSLDTGWDSGRVALKDSATIDVTLPKMGDNTFKVWVFDAKGGPIKFENNKIIIARTEGEITGIPASSSIFIEKLAHVGGPVVSHYLVKKSGSLPAKGKASFKSTESLKAGSSGSINFVIREGEIEDKVGENELIGTFLINGGDFNEGVIPAGAELICEYEVQDSGCVHLDISVPSISSSFVSKNYFSTKNVTQDYSKASRRVIDEAEKLRARLDEVAEKVGDDEKLIQASNRLQKGEALQAGETDPETNKEAHNSVQDAKRLLAEVRKTHQKEMRQMDLDACVDYFNSKARAHAKTTEVSAFDSLAKTAQRAIEARDIKFDGYLRDLWQKSGEILRRQDWFVIDYFNYLAESDHVFANVQQHAELVAAGKAALKADNIDKLREIVGAMNSIRIDGSSDQDMLVVANIVGS